MCAYHAGKTQYSTALKICNQVMISSLWSSSKVPYFHHDHHQKYHISQFAEQKPKYRSAADIIIIISDSKHYHHYHHSHPNHTEKYHHHHKNHHHHICRAKTEAQICCRRTATEFSWVLVLKMRAPIISMLPGLQVMMMMFLLVMMMMSSRGRRR